MIEHDDRWEIPVHGLTVTQCRIDFAFLLLLAEPKRPGVLIRIENAFAVRWPDGSAWTWNPDDGAVALSAALGLFNLLASSGIAHKCGTLELAFTDGSYVLVEPDPDFEAWTVSGDNGLLIVALPGGELAVWDPR